MKFICKLLINRWLTIRWQSAIRVYNKKPQLPNGAAAYFQHLIWKYLIDLKMLPHPGRGTSATWLHSGIHSRPRPERPSQFNPALFQYFLNTFNIFHREGNMVSSRPAAFADSPCAPTPAPGCHFYKRHVCNGAVFFLYPAFPDRLEVKNVLVKFFCCAQYP